MYSERAKERRRCLGTRKDGEPCRAWAVWGADRQLCVRHLRGGRGPEWKRVYAIANGHWPEKPRNVPSCRCGAYSFAHRPGGGRCQWPDV